MHMSELQSSIYNILFGYQWEHCDRQPSHNQNGTCNLTILIVLRRKVWHKQKSKTLRNFVVFFGPTIVTVKIILTIIVGDGKISTMSTVQMDKFVSWQFWKFVQLFFFSSLFFFAFLIDKIIDIHKWQKCEYFTSLLHSQMQQLKLVVWSDIIFLTFEHNRISYNFC